MSYVPTDTQAPEPLVYDHDGAEAAPDECPACSGKVLDVHGNSIGKCQRCGGVCTLEPVPRSRAIQYVRLDLPMVEQPDGVTLYFDVVLEADSFGPLRRVHGWMQTNGRVTQYG